MEERFNFKISTLNYSLLTTALHAYLPLVALGKCLSPFGECKIYLGKHVSFGGCARVVMDSLLGHLAWVG